MSKPSNRKKFGVWFVLLFAAVGIAVGIVGGLLLSRSGADKQAITAAGTDDSEQWYTCGMHPNVIQQGSGNCPICQMKLTPLRAGQDQQKAEKGPSERRVLYFRAPMDPNYVSEKPGKSPMGMDLVPVYAEQGESPSVHTITIDPVTIQNMGIRTTEVKRGALVRTIRTVGRVDYNEELVTFINTKFEGWIEKLHINQTGQRVSKGQAMFDVYSPQLYSAQVEYLAAQRGLEALAGGSQEVREQARRLLDAADTKLQYLDVTKDQIAELAQTRSIQKSLTIHCPTEGIVTDKMILEGMYIKPGMRLYTIADLSQVWVYVDIYEYQLPWVAIGQTAIMRLSYIPGREFVGKVVYIYPYLEARTRVIKVRLEFENPTLDLKPDMYATITLRAQLGQALLVPREAYIDSGIRKVVFVDLGGGKFQPRDIQVGVEGQDGMVEVLYGLDQGDVVVTSGQFMLDSESKLKEAVAKMMEVSRQRAKKGPEPTIGDQQSEQKVFEDLPASMPADTKFACPMERHPGQTDPANSGPYFSPKPGECPRCGMTLEALEDLPWAQVAKAAEGDKVAYTCPVHTHVFAETSDNPCPRCGRTLEPFKAMYTCPDIRHAGVISITPDLCPHCSRDLVPYRGIWLGEEMAEANVPPSTQLAATAAYRCPIHPLVHSSQAGVCTICAATLQATKSATGVKPATQEATTKFAAQFICPMHPGQARSDVPGTCSICAMQLVPVRLFAPPSSAPGHLNSQLNYVTEHYLALQKLLSSDSTVDVAQHALAIAAASDQMLAYLSEVDIADRQQVEAVMRKLRAAALEINGNNINQDRVNLVEVSAAMVRMLDHFKPDVSRWPKLYIFHCPMTKGDWVQASENMVNPYYGSKMPKCGQLRETK